MSNNPSRTKLVTKQPLDTGIVKKTEKPAEDVKIMSNLDNRITKILPDISCENTT